MSRCHSPSTAGYRSYLPWCFGLFLVSITAFVYRPVMDYGFVVWDDNLHVYANPRFQPVTWEHVLAFWRAPYAGLYMPLTYTVWAALVWLTQTLASGPLTAGLFHRLNLLLHLGSVLVVYRIALLVLRRTAGLYAQRPVIAAALGTLVFAVHPLQVEAVAWVSGLKDVLCGWWALVALWQYLEYVLAPDGWRRTGHYALATLAFGLALLAKPSAVVVPVLAGLLAVAGMGQAWTSALRGLGGWLIVAVVWGWWAKGQQPDVVLAYVAPWWGRYRIAADAVGFYLQKLVWPFALGPDYGRTPRMVLSQGQAYVTWLFVFVFGLGWAWRRHRSGNVWLAAGVFVAGVLPVLGLVPFMFQVYSTVADRYVYVALLGPALGIGCVVQRVHSRGVVWLTALLMLGLLGWRSTEQVQIWRDTVSLFTHALQVTPHSTLAHNNLGWALFQQGKLDAAMTHYRQVLQRNPQNVTAHTNLGSVLVAQGKVAAGIAHYQEALRLNPEALEARYNLGNALRRQGKLEAAVAHYRKALQHHPAWAEVHNNLGSALDDLGRVAEAVTHYQEAIRLKPDLAAAHNNLGDAWLDLGRVREAANEFLTAVRLQPAWAEAQYNLGVVLTRLGQPRQAMQAYREALRLRPDWPSARLQLAWLLAAQPNPSAAATREAVMLAEQVNRSADRRDAVALFTLAVAYAADGRKTTALQTARRALTQARISGNPGLISEIESRFSLPSGLQRKR